MMARKALRPLSGFSDNLLSDNGGFRCQCSGCSSVRLRALVPVVGRHDSLMQSFRTQAMSTQIYSFIMSLIDGKRSLQDMAIVLENQKLMSREEAEPAIRSFLTRMYDDAQKQAGF